MKSLLAFLGISALIIWATVQANEGADNLLFKVVYWLPFGDKIGHFLLFGVLTSLSLMAIDYVSGRLCKVKVAIIYLLLFGWVIIDETLQLAAVHRTFDVWDLLTGLLGIILFVAATTVGLNRR